MARRRAPTGTRARRAACGLLLLATGAVAPGWTGEFGGAHRGFKLVKDPPNVQEIVRSIAEFAVICEAINRKVENDFEEAQEYVIGFDAVRPIYEYNRRWDFDAYKRQAHSVTSLKEEMEQISLWIPKNGR